MKFSFITLGCKVNQFESQAMSALLEERGHSLAEKGEPADAYIINTCAVTAESSRKSRQAVRRAMAENPNTITAVCGCWAQISPDEAASLGAELVFGSTGRLELVRAIERAFEDRSTLRSIDNPMGRREFEILPAGSGIGRTRAMLKVQDGCQNFCAYCIIPYARGPVRSMSPDHAVSEARRLEREGYRELVITGIEISSYGRDIGGVGLTELTEKICLSAPGMRVRLGSLEPRTVTEDFCKRLSALTNLCPHFHLSLQSGSGATLRRMGRKYTPDEFYEGVSMLRRHFPNCGITTDLIVGFPGETEEEFAETLHFIEKCAFSSMHIFPYSKRPGTRAATMEGHLDKAVKRARAKQASRLARRMKDDFLNSQIGRLASVLFETESQGFITGFTGNYCEVGVRSGAARNETATVKITGKEGDILTGEVV